MKIAALIMVTLAAVATSEAARVRGSCKVYISKVSGGTSMDCEATMPDGSTRSAKNSASGSYPKICDSQEVICWQMNKASHKNIDVFYAGKVKSTSGSVSNEEDSDTHISWRTRYDVNF
ncbi:hypothetical protein BGW38_001729 [Lunasporangiospora selenospora]|uniref:Uncharacterized protein n=1 Tax=Lunasporangiospora selenospora TaxID=979761 RepID=A0A9P6FV67_9FUNG|nr:hypothetical protein BGW38_001729 [Lunasporangiospora selenospora]